ncbi:MAG: hypothetical protein JXA73_05320 [Acidobacteria bacterium]|nr:hypothetical protein [Acidobacteriota bacterium]
MPKPKRNNNQERRAARRLPVSQIIPKPVARLNTGQEVELVNVGLNGTVLVKTRIMLHPGSFVRLRLKMPNEMINLDGRVQRSRVIGVKQTKIMYEAAVILDKGLPQSLADIVQRMDEPSSPAEQSSDQEPNPALTNLSESAQIWVLNTPSSGAEA